MTFPQEKNQQSELTFSVSFYSNHKIYFILVGIYVEVDFFGQLYITYIVCHSADSCPVEGYGTTFHQGLL